MKSDNGAMTMVLRIVISTLLGLVLYIVQETRADVRALTTDMTAVKVDIATVKGQLNNE